MSRDEEVLRLLLDGLFSKRGCQPLIEVPVDTPLRMAYAADVAHTKRFLERYVADRVFREQLARDPTTAAARYGLRCDPEDIRALWDPKLRKEAAARSASGSALAVLRYRAFRLEQRLRYVSERTRRCAPVHPRYRAWRQRQINRCESELGGERAVWIAHLPFAIELSRGCSVGCWFCALNAVKHIEDFRYGGANTRLWRDVLETLRALVGPQAEGLCYWATEPFDNPDYEMFCRDMAEVFGRFPRTTTALPHKNVERTRKLLQSANALGCEVLRFSILSLSVFNRVMKEFSAEELLHTDVMPRNPESLNTLLEAGKARGDRRLDQMEARRVSEGHALSGRAERFNTSACVSGFLLNMVQRRVQLITPCIPSTHWPMGYRILAEEHFGSGSELDGILRDMIDGCMAVGIGADERVAFRADLTHCSTHNGFRLDSGFASLAFEASPPMRRLGELVAAGRLSTTEIARRLYDEQGLESSWTLEQLTRLFEAGVLEEDPAAVPPSVAPHALGSEAPPAPSVPER